MCKKLETFIVVVEQMGFAKAAKKLNLSKATVTRYIQELENEYKTTLFNRSTRNVNLTEQGEVLYQHALEIIQIQQQARDQLDHNQSINGHLKIGLPQSIMHDLIETILPQLTQDYPDLSFELIQGNHIFNVLSSQFDLALHCGPLPDINLHFQKLGSWQRTLAASPKYLQEFGTPKNIDQLQQHNCLDHADNHNLTWPLVVGGQVHDISIRGNIKINSSMALTQAATQHYGIVYLPTFSLNNAINKGLLEEIMPSYWSKPLNVYALYPGRRVNNPKIAMIIEHLKQLWNDIPTNDKNCENHQN
jgi:LysR family transcriptional regulator, regulator for bpeEF and oprC